MVTKAENITDDYCSTPNPLTGFPPSKESVDTWMNKLKENGIVEGSPVRIIGGKDEGKIVSFSFNDICISDCGLGSKKYLGWFYRQSDEACVYPIFDIIDSSLEINNSDEYIKETNKKYCALGTKLIDLNLNALMVLNIEGKVLKESTCPVESSDALSDYNLTNEIYAFKKLNDFWAWLEQNY
jgi:hypothetical protein